jgi:hypothetical protein
MVLVSKVQNRADDVKWVLSYMHICFCMVCERRFPKCVHR